MLRGTPGYLSPEQVRLDPASPQTDVYALGIVAYEMLTGTHPFPDSPMQELLDHHLREAIPSVRETRPELPPAVDAVIARATAKDARERFSEALELAAAFRAALWGGTTVAEPAVEIRNPYKGLRAFLEADAGTSSGARRSPNVCSVGSRRTATRRGSLRWSGRRARASPRWFARGSFRRSGVAPSRGPSIGT
jgi:serine/threonine protein kinase